MDEIRKSKIITWSTIKNIVAHKHSSRRFVELDMLRGLAIILMVFGHVLWDLDYFGIFPMNNGIYSFLQKTVPPLFFILVGIGIVVSKKKMENKAIEEQEEYYRRLFVRGLKIFGLGMILTMISLVFMPEKVVFFGVLHCIGLSIVLSVPFLKYQKYALPSGIFVLFVFLVASNFFVENPTILHLVLGFHQANIWQYTVDYFPLVPWFGVTLIGIVLGDVLYCGDKRRFRMPDLSKYGPVKIFQWAGQHSLGIYLLHQPIIAGVMAVFVLL